MFSFLFLCWKNQWWEMDVIKNASAQNKNSSAQILFLCRRFLSNMLMFGGWFFLRGNNHLKKSEFDIESQTFVFLLILEGCFKYLCSYLRYRLHRSFQPFVFEILGFRWVCKYLSKYISVFTFCFNSLKNVKKALENYTTGKFSLSYWKNIFFQ